MADCERTQKRKSRGNGEGSWYRRKRTLADGRIVEDVAFATSIGYDEKGRRKRRLFCGPTKAAVRAKVERAKTLAGGSLRAASALTVVDFLEDWLAGVERSRSSVTMRSYAGRIRRLAIPNLGKKRLEDLDQPDIAKLYATLLAQGKSADNIRKLHKALRRAFNVAIGKGLIRHNPTAFVELPKHRVAERESYDADEVKAFFIACTGDRLEALFRLGVLAAMRPGELFALHRNDLALDDLAIDVRHNLEDAGGKLAIVDAKADSARRIPISESTAALLRRHLATMDKEKHGSPYVFVTERGKWLRNARVNRRLSEIVKAAELDPITLYSLRHTGISLFSAAGVTLNVTADIVGHSDTGITSNVYTHTFEPQHRTAVAKVESMLNAA